MRYKIIYADGWDEFERRVNEALKDGWVLQGGVSLAIRYEHAYCFAQAMILQTK